MFALLALGGDMGCAGGPTLVGMISDSLGDNLKMGILAGIIFPVLFASWNSPLQKREHPFIMSHAKKACRDINPNRLSYFASFSSFIRN